MSKEEAVLAIEGGIKYIEEGINKGYSLFGTGEMGIGNTTTSSAVLSAITKQPAEATAGYSASLSIDMYKHKIDIINNILKRQAGVTDPLELVSKFCGFDLATMAGVFLGGSYYRKPVVVDGFISAVSALVAYKINHKVKDYLIFSHISTGSGFKLIEEAMGEKAPLNFNICLGEGSGCLLMFKMIDSSIAVMKNMGKLANCNIDKNILVDIREK